MQTLQRKQGTYHKEWQSTNNEIENRMANTNTKEKKTSEFVLNSFQVQKVCFFILWCTYAIVRYNDVGFSLLFLEDIFLADFRTQFSAISTEHSIQHDNTTVTGNRRFAFEAIEFEV